MLIFLSVFYRNTSDGGRGDGALVARVAGAGERGRAARLPHARRHHVHAPRCGEEQLRGGEDAAGPGRLAQLQGLQGPHAALPLHEPQRRPHAVRGAAPRPRRRRGAGRAGMAGGPPGQIRKISHFTTGMRILDDF